MGTGRWGGRARDGGPGSGPKPGGGGGGNENPHGPNWGARGNRATASEKELKRSIKSVQNDPNMTEQHKKNVEESIRNAYSYRK